MWFCRCTGFGHRPEAAVLKLVDVATGTTAVVSETEAVWYCSVKRDGALDEPGAKNNAW